MYFHCDVWEFVITNNLQIHRIYTVFDNMEATVTSPKNTVFQLRMNKEVKDAAEELFSRCGLTLSDALNLFIQQSLNCNGIPFEIRGNRRSISKEQALDILLAKLDDSSQSSKKTAYTSDEVRKRYGIL